MEICDERIFWEFREEYLKFLEERQYDVFDGAALYYLDTKIERVRDDDNYVMRCACELALSLIKDLRG